MTKVEKWAKEADQGSRFVYHVGTSAFGEECRAARDLYEGGLVLLIQKRGTLFKGNRAGIPNGLFEYIAHRTGKKL
jgi:hypothetical protein